MPGEGAGGHEVGRISIRVVPNTERFREELHAQLQGIEDTEKVHIKAEFDSNGLREKAKAAAEEAGAEAKIKVKADDKSLDLFQKRMMSELGSAHKQFEKNIPLTSQGEALRRAMEKDVLGISTDTRRKVPMDLELAAGQREKILADVEAVRRMAEAKPIKLKLNPEFDYRLHNRLAGMRPPAEEAPRGQSLLSRIDNLGSGASGFGLPNLGSIGNFGSPANLLAIMSLLPAALAVAAPALASLPALFGAVALPVGTLALGMDGLKKAAEDAGVAVPKKDKKGKDTDKLTAGGALKQIQEAVSGVFEQGFTPLLSRIIALTPEATIGLKSIASGIVSLATGAVDAFTSSGGMNAMNTLASNVSGLMSASAPGLQAFTTGLLNLAAQVSTHFPGLAAFFNGLGDRFSGWVSKITADGTLDKAIAGLGPVMGSLFDFVGKLMDAGMKLAADPQMITSIKVVIDALASLILASLPALGGAFKSLATVIGLITGKNPNPAKPGTGQGQYVPGQGRPQDDGGGLPTRSSISQGMVDNLQGAFGSPGGSINALGMQIPTGKLVQQAQQAVQAVAGVFAGLPGAVGGAFDGIYSAAATAFDRLASAAGTAVDKVMVYFHNLPGQIVSALAGLGDALYTAGAKAVGQLVRGLTSIDVTGTVAGIMGSIKSLIPNSPAKEGPFSGSGWTSLFTGGQSIGDQFGKGLEGGFQGVLSRAQAAMGALSDALAKGVVPPNLKGDLQQSLSEIGAEYDQLRVQRDETTDKGARKSLEEQMKQLQTLKDQLRAGEDQAGITNQMGKNDPKDLSQVMQQQLGTSLQGMVGIGEGFAHANVSQLQQDLGISGHGAIPTIAQELMKWGTGMANNLVGSAFGDKKDSVHIHVNNVDDALAAQQNIKNKQALAYSGSGR